MAGMVVARLVAELDADTSKAEKDLSRVDGKLHETDRSMGGVASTAKGVGVAMVAAFGAQQIIRGITSTIMAGANLNETIAKTGVVFGAAGGVVTDAADQMADDFGTPRQAFLDAASSIGLIGKAAGQSQGDAAGMATEMARLAADASSFYNIPLEEALGSIRSGLVGEAEPLRRFGVLLSEAAVQEEAVRLGIAEVGDELSEGEKVRARASLITAGLADASGDLYATQDSLANQLRNVQGDIGNAAAALGQQLVPAVSAAIDIGYGAVEMFGDVGRFLAEHEELVIAAGLAYSLHLVPHLTGAAVSLGGFASRKFNESLEAVAVSAKNAGGGVGGLATAAGRLGAQAIGIGVVTAGVAFAIDYFRDATREGREFAETIAGDPQTTAQFTASIDAQQESVSNLTAQYDVHRAAAEEGLGAAVGAFGDQLRLSQELRGLGDTLEATSLQSYALGMAQVDVRRATGMSKEAIADLAGETEGWATMTREEAVAALLEQTEALGFGSSAALDLADATGTLGSETATATDKLGAFRDAMDAALGVKLDAREAALDLADQLTDLQTTLAENGAVLGTTTEAGIANERAIMDTIDAYRAQNEATAATEGVTSGLVGTIYRQRDALVDQMVAFGFTESAANDYLDSLGYIPEDITTQIFADVSPALLEVYKLQDELARLEGQGFNVTISGPGGRTVGVGGITESTGGVIDFYGRGGLSERHVAQVAPAGAWRVWAEPETGGEAYIPRLGDRDRSMAVLQEAAGWYGASLYTAAQGVAFVPPTQRGRSGGDSSRELVREIRMLNERVASMRPVNQTINTQATDPHEVARVAARVLAWELGSL